MSCKTPVTILQEFMVQRQQTPNYNLICSEIGTHEPLFKYLVTGLGLSAVGSGKSKKEAKHEAARLLLRLLEERGHNDIELKTNPILKEVNTCYSPYDDTIKDNAVGALQLLCCEYLLPNPQYDLIQDIGPPHFKIFTIKCTISSFKTQASARTKKQAKHRCSAMMMDKLRQCLSNYFKFPSENDDKYDNETLSCDLAKRTVHLGTPLRDLFNILTTSHYPFPQVLDELISNTQKADYTADPLETLNKLSSEMSFDVDIKQIPSKSGVTVVNIFLVAKPGWSFLGNGESYDEAVKAAAIEAIEFLIFMSKR